MNTVITDRNLRQIKQHGSCCFPISVCLAHLSEYKDGQFPNHWHEDFEFLLVRSGQMLCTANSESVSLSPGDAVFINSGALHTAISTGREDCAYSAVTLHPDFFGLQGTTLVETYVTPFCDSPFFNLYKIAADHPSAKLMLSALQAICTLYDSQEISRSIDIYTHVLILWKELFLLCRDALSFDFCRSESERLHNMVSYIKKNYSHPIALDQIAEAAGISKSSCSHLFKQYMKESPFHFLLRYRIDKGCKLLISTNMTITEISAEVGLCTSSYFCEMFKRLKGITPSAFRSQNR